MSTTATKQSLTNISSRAMHSFKLNTDVLERLIDEKELDPSEFHSRNLQLARLLRESGYIVFEGTHHYRGVPEQIVLLVEFSENKGIQDFNFKRDFYGATEKVNLPYQSGDFLTQPHK